MVRWLVVLFALTLLLTGCAQETTAPTDSTDNTTQSLASQEQPVLDAALESFQLDGSGYYGCTMLGNELVLMRQSNGAGELSLCDAQSLKTVRTLALGESVVPEMAQMQISDKGIGYFDSKNRAMVFLNTNFVEIGRMYLPENLEGDAWLSPDWKTVHYCTEEGIHVLDLQTHISRLLKEQQVQHQQITGSFGNGQVLRCVVETAEKEKQTFLIDAASGMVLKQGAYLETLLTQTETYFFPQMAGGVLQLRYGTGDQHQVLWAAEEDGQANYLFANDAIVMVQSGENETKLTYYDLKSGKRTGEITLTDVMQVWSLQGDGADGVWLLGSKQEGAETLYHWKTAENPLTDENIYTAPYYTLENPDEAGLQRVAQAAAELGERFGVEILIWKDAAATAPDDHIFTPEHMTQACEDSLAQLEKLLSQFPEGFFTETPGGKLQIALLRGIAGEPEWGSLEQSTRLQFWNGDVPVMAFVTGEDISGDFYHAAAHFIDTLVLSKSSALYEWERLNPKDFSYDNSYITNLQRTDTAYVEGEDRYFIDMFSMSYAKEDRARIFEYACLESNEEYFKAPVIQEKLRRICKGIRTAFGLKKVETTFLWEQYLTT